MCGIAVRRLGAFVVLLALLAPVAARAGSVSVVFTDGCSGGIGSGGSVCFASACDAASFDVFMSNEVGDTPLGFGSLWLVFVTSTARDATSGDIEDYNAFVTNVANSVPGLAALGTSWSAVVSTYDEGSNSLVEARDNTRTNPSVDGIGVPIYLLNNYRIASDYPDLWDGTIGHPINVFEDRVQGTTGPVWTGSGSDGRAAMEGAAALPGSATSDPAYGAMSLVDDQWIDYSVYANTSDFRLYAISDVLIVPEPSAPLQLIAGLGLLVALARLGHRTKGRVDSSALPSSEPIG